MSRYKTILLTLCAVIYFLPGHAAEKGMDDTTGVIVYADSRLDILTRRDKMSPIRSGRGFRLQIYSGIDKHKAIQTKIDFMRRFPDIPTYMTYVQPQFRIKVGNFQTRADAQVLYRQITDIYAPVMIVPDIIVINTLKHD